MDELRRFTALRRRLNALQQESYTTARVLEVTDWHSAEHSAELQALTIRNTVLDDEIADIEYLLDYYERTMLRSKSLIVSPYTVLLIMAIVVMIFTATTLAAGVLAGVIDVGH